MNDQLVRAMLDELPDVVVTPEISLIRAEAARRAQARTTARRWGVAVSIVVIATFGAFAAVRPSLEQQVATNDGAQSQAASTTTAPDPAAAAAPVEAAAAESFSVEIEAGLTVDEMIEQLVAQRPEFSSAEFNRSLEQRLVESSLLPSDLDALVAVEGVRTPYEGLLSSGTYELASGTDETEVLQVMADSMQAQFDAVLAEVGGVRPTIGGLGTREFDDYELFIIASLIESETFVDADQSFVASTIYNRLRDGWGLGIDAPLTYVWGEITAELLDTEHPYNTRLQPGLPPTPISSPGLGALRASLSPADGDWYFYVLTNHGGVEGAFTFAATEEEFVQAVMVCRELGLGC